MLTLLNWVSLTLQVAAVLAVSITEIQGIAFQSPLVGQTVRDVEGIVTAKVSRHIANLAVTSTFQKLQLSR